MPRPVVGGAGGELRAGRETAAIWRGRLVDASGEVEDDGARLRFPGMTGESPILGRIAGRCSRGEERRTLFPPLFKRGDLASAGGEGRTSVDDLARGAGGVEDRIGSLWFPEVKPEEEEWGGWWDGAM